MCNGSCCLPLLLPGRVNKRFRILTFTLWSFMISECFPYIFLLRCHQKIVLHLYVVTVRFCGLSHDIFSSYLSKIIHYRPVYMKYICHVSVAGL